MDSPQSSDAAATAANKPRHTEAQKKQNHIISERKRRKAIRKSFDRLSQSVPGMRGQGSREAMLLSATVEHMKLQIKRRETLRKLAAEKGMGNAEFEKVYEDEAKSLSEAGIAGSPSAGGGGAGAGGKQGGGDNK
ncbi:hypothetical protein D0865_02930 [Hortaea werneckii]|uniref:BHLH domain-containing protein n=1 Tax=Hortaea werneckii TaxID=91943 RepID=A0A3M7D0R8_HORWE|nr:hypothetical protein D0865_02930 [Hortaea werneckii]